MTISKREDSPVDLAEADAGRGAGARLKALAAVVLERYATLLLLVILIIGFTAATPRFLNAGEPDESPRRAGGHFLRGFCRHPAADRRRV